MCKIFDMFKGIYDRLKQNGPVLHSRFNLMNSIGQKGRADETSPLSMKADGDYELALIDAALILMLVGLLGMIIDALGSIFRCGRR